MMPKVGDKLTLKAPGHSHVFEGTVIKIRPLTLGEMTVNGEPMYRDRDKVYKPKIPQAWIGL